MRAVRMRAAVLLVLLLATAGVIFVSPARAETEQGVSLSAGTFTRTEYVSDSLGVGVRLDQAVDDFAANTCNPSTGDIWDGCVAADISGGVLTMNPEGTGTERFWGGTQCYTNDDASGCSTGTPAIPDVLNPPRASFQLTITEFTDLTGNGAIRAGIVQCSNYNTACPTASGDDGEQTWTTVSPIAPVRNFIGIRFDAAADATTADVWPLILDDDGTLSQPDAATRDNNACAESVACAIVGTWVEPTLTITITSGGTTTTMTQTNNGDDIEVNSIGIAHGDTTGEQIGIRVDDMTPTYRTQGATWVTETVGAPAGSDVLGTVFSLSFGAGTTRTVCSAGAGCTWVQSSVTLATYSTAITAASTEIRETNLASGSFVALESFTISITFTGDRIFSPVITRLTVLVSDTGGGGGGAPPPGPPTDLKFRCDALTDADWLLPGTRPGSRTVTLYDLRPEAILVVEYLIAWGDGRATVAGMLPVNHTYAREDVYTITMRLVLRTGDVQIFVTRADLRGNNCALQMFAQDFFGPLVALAALALVVAIILTWHNFRTRKRGAGRVQKGLLGVTVVTFGLLIAVAVYAAILGTPI